MLALLGILGLIGGGAVATGLGGYFLSERLSKRNTERTMGAVDYEYEKLGRRQITAGDLFEELKK